MAPKVKILIGFDNQRQQDKLAYIVEQLNIDNINAQMPDDPESEEIAKDESVVLYYSLADVLNAICEFIESQS
jgi:hypothetical protein